MALFRKPPEPVARGGRSYKRTPITNNYRSKNQPGQPSPFRTKPPPKNRRKYLLGIVDIILVILLLAGLVNSLLLSTDPKVSVTDLTYRPQKTYQSSVKAAFAGFKNRNKITFDEQIVVAKIQSQFPEVEAVQVELPFISRQPRVRLVISPPAFKLVSNNRAYIIDSQGFAVATADSLPKFPGLVTLNDQSGFSVSAGRQVLSRQSVSFIRTLIEQSRRAKVPIASLSLPALPQELDLRTSDQPYFVKFYLGGDVDTETGQFLATRAKFIRDHTAPSEYLDVRVAGKIFYK
jgi:cell division septal protein FtsQ